MKNLDIRIAIKHSRFKQYEIADQLNIAETSLCRKLRKELNDEEKKQILQAIEKLKQKNN